MEILNRAANTLNVVTVSRIKGVLDNHTARQALNLLQSRHPRLSSCIVGSLDNLRFKTKTACEIPLIFLESHYSELWEEAVLHELNQGLEAHDSLIRVTLVSQQRTNDLFFITTIHHAISDGFSSIQLHSDFLSYCERIISGEKDIVLLCLPAIAPAEELLPKTYQSLKSKLIARMLMLMLKLAMRIIKPQALKFEQNVDISQRKCCWTSRRLDQENTANLVHQCRQHQTTVQGALLAAMLLIVARKIRSETQNGIPILWRSYVDLRKRLEPAISNENLGLLASAVGNITTLYANTSFWELAKDLRKNIEEKLLSGDHFHSVWAARNFVEYLLCNADEQNFTDGVSLTNVGRVDIPKNYGALQLEEISFMPSQAAFGGVFTACVTTFQNKMTINFVAASPLISQATLEELADYLMNFILGL